jgi:hypothetical protein
VCGYIHDGENPPEKCPKCGAPKEKFSALEEAEANLVHRSRFTNNLQCRLIALMDEVLKLAEAGIEDDLDPPCVSLFKYADEHARIIGQAAKAEIRGHMGKGKWG